MADGTATVVLTHGGEPVGRAGWRASEQDLGGGNGQRPISEFMDPVLVLHQPTPKIDLMRLGDSRVPGESVVIIRGGRPIAILDRGETLALIRDAGSHHL